MSDPKHLATVPSETPITGQPDRVIDVTGKACVMCNTPGEKCEALLISDVTGAGVCVSCISASVTGVAQLRIDRAEKEAKAQLRTLGCEFPQDHLPAGSS